MLIIKTLPSLFDWCALPEWIQRFREILCMCGNGLCGHWYILRLMTTHTWCKLRHCSSVAVTSLSGVKSEPALACLANPPFRAISTFSSPKWGPPWAMNHRVYLSSCPLTLNQYNYPVGSTLHFYKSSRGISFHMENIGKSLLSLDMYINHVLLICPLAHQGPGRHIWITKLVMILYPSFIDCNKKWRNRLHQRMNQNTKSFYGENWFEVIFKISYVFPAWLNMVNTTAANGLWTKESVHHVTMPA